jgi:alkylhydroperoxidase/carboxymuconolactone decarboxylase family protein YurZ
MERMSTTDVETRREGLRAAFVEDRGYWSEELDDLLLLDPSFFEQVLSFTNHPWRRGVLEPKVKELILLAVDAAATHRNGPGAVRRVRRALALGASQQEVLEVLELTSTVAIHSCNCGVPVLLEELAAAGQAVDVEAPLTEFQEEVKATFARKRGYWNTFWDGVLRLDAEFFAAYTAFSSHPWEHGTLPPKVRELVYTAFDASATHMYEPGLRQHIRNAIAYGATGAEVMEVLELAAGIGVDALTLALPGFAAPGDA